MIKDPIKNSGGTFHFDDNDLVEDIFDSGIVTDDHPFNNDMLLIDTTKHWVPGALVGKYVRLLNQSTGCTSIKSNDETTLQLSQEYNAPTHQGDTYEIYDTPYAIINFQHNLNQKFVVASVWDSNDMMFDTYQISPARSWVFKCLDKKFARLYVNRYSRPLIGIYHLRITN
jgi:hypothetical protein